MSTLEKTALPNDMSTDEFIVWNQSLDDGARYELVEGRPVRLQSEQVRHSEIRLSVAVAFRNGLKEFGLSSCRAFPDGVGIKIGPMSVREPDALVHCGPYDGSDSCVSNPVVVVGVVSPSSARSDAGPKLSDYFSVMSIEHYLLLYGDEERVVHHRQTQVVGEIATRILGRGDIVDLSPPGFTVSVDALFDS